MNFSSMEYFTTLAQELNFTRAARRLHITQQSLSAHIAGMEKELGCPLIVRHVPLELTYAGKVLLRYAENFQRERLELEQEFCDISQNQKGILRLGVAFTRGRAVLPKIIAAFQCEYPNICVEMVEASNDDLHMKLVEGDLDLAIANFPESLKEVELRDFYSEEVVLLMARELFERLYPPESDEGGASYNKTMEAFLMRDFSGLKNCPFVLGSEDDISGRIGREFLRKTGVAQPIIKATSDNVETLMTLSLLGVGASFSPENLAKNALTREQLESLLVFRLGSDAKYPIRFGYPAHSYQWSVISDFMRIAEDQKG